MKNRASSHIFILLLIGVLTAIAHYAIYYGALIRGYETSWVTAGRNLGLLFILTILPLFLTRFTRFQGNWTLYTTAVLLFSIGLTVQYRLFSDLEYSSRDKKAEARQAKLETQQQHYIQENYSAEKKQMMGMPAEPPAPVDLSKEKPRPASESAVGVFTSGRTLIPLFAFALFFAAFYFFRREKVLSVLQRNGFLLVILTLIPLMLAAFTSQAGKSIGNMTPWEPSKIPFLIGFAAILATLYRKLMQTYWGMPRARDVMPLMFMAVLPFIPFFVLKDFGQMLVFSSVYVTLYLIAVRRLPQRLVFVGSVAFLVAVLMLSALPASVQVKVPLLSTLAQPVKTILPPRIHQRFHLWFDALTPPSPDTPFWKGDLAEFYWKQYRAELMERKPDTEPLYDELSKIENNKNADAKAKARASEIRAELKRVAAEDLALMYELTKSEAATEEIPPDKTEIERNQAEEQDVREIRERLHAMNEEAWFGDDALQASRATFGISSGGVTGRGLGLGYVELIPVADSDYIYAALGEELGLFGGLLIIFALLTLVSAGVRTALDARDMFSKLCAAGLTAFIGFQALVNMGGITRALPMTGITLPFVSHGGFSLITSFVMLGMLMAISHRNAIDVSINNNGNGNGNGNGSKQ
ncbi:MAG TPA: FtsW/RodA/SpoVE family cell cycle protein [Pyrinomonadaceae bacterium]|nr:FtsW/RodA/SpoVE family cell cycle protein [Pyrinomonadaceae bacterium]